MTGTIRTLRLDKGFGFIKDNAGKEYFFHSSGLKTLAFDEVNLKDAVEFEPTKSPKGPRAESIEVL